MKNAQIPGSSLVIRYMGFMVGAVALAAVSALLAFGLKRAPTAPSASSAVPRVSVAGVSPPADMMAHSCAACHGTNGQLSDEYFAPLAGMPVDQFVNTMVDFREGRRSATLMGLVAKGFSDDDLRKMGEFFAAQERGEP